ncbi:28S ribosomal protein S10, mitochondrial isoform X1 [Rhinatrema bivittatum]|uniref:28S ribosomal protein S10, mitochondrial isoform X1 n=1 Tax=Rhinatrema bivittatum TaxID=194408 RepID=UPI00112756FB|nr:28S ribosomal protein S10, mitochondrial isoform X1 [Rhinatrema bivittatum]XP_029449153.1 28S ribosomal protein S10, mitochondrial isoform X1 [Rhinatrema bivittatum]
MCAALLCCRFSRMLQTVSARCQGFSWMLPLNHFVRTAAARNKYLIWVQSSGSHTASSQHTESPLISISDEPDTLFKKIAVLAKGHDRAVLDSYEYFAVLTAKELGITIGNVYEPPRKIERLTLLKSIHIYKKHRVQYEMRTHYRCLELKISAQYSMRYMQMSATERALLKHLTGSTADVYLEYIQRNLPEGVALEIKKTKLEKVPEHIKKPVWDKMPPAEEN